MPRNSRGSSTISPSHSLEVEHRLTTREIEHQRLIVAHEDQSEQIEAIRKKLALHEKTILAILGLLEIVFQDKYPAVAALLKTLAQ